MYQMSENRGIEAVFGRRYSPPIVTIMGYKMVVGLNRSLQRVDTGRLALSEDELGTDIQRIVQFNADSLPNQSSVPCVDVCM
jgi:hypothetical protein